MDPVGGNKDGEQLYMALIYFSNSKSYNIQSKEKKNIIEEDIKEDNW